MSTDAVDIRVRLHGGRVAKVEADGVSRAVRRIGRESTRTRGVLGGLRGVVSGLSGPMYALGGASRAAAYALAAAGTAGGIALARMGWDYNQTIDSQRIAFTTFMRSGRKAEAFMRRLQRLALDSPVLDIGSTGNAARSLMAYGVAIKDVLPLVKAIGDMSSASGRSIEEVMPRAAMAIGQVQSKGRLQAEELNQLAESVGLSRGRIRKALGMSRDEFNASFTASRGISSDRALPAIRKAMERQSQGAARMLAGTTAGRIARLKEVVSRGVGEVTRGLYDGIGRFAGRAADFLQRVNFRQVARDVGDWLRRAFEWARQAASDFLDAIRPAQPFLQNVLIPLFRGFAVGVFGSLVAAVKVLVPVFMAFMRALGWVGRAAAPLRGIIRGVGVVLGFILAGPVLKAIGLLGKFGGVFRVVGTAARIARLPIAILGRAVGAVGRILAGTGRVLVGVMQRIATAPTSALAGLRGGLARMLDAIAGFGGKFMAAGKRLIGRLVAGLKGAIGSGIGFAADLGKAVANAAIKLVNDAFPNKIPMPGPVPDISLPANPIPMLARGGVVSGPGSWITGEAGPELNTRDRAGRVHVQPLTRHGRLDPLLSGAMTVRVPVFLDRRQIAEAVGSVVRDRNNRR